MELHPVHIYFLVGFKNRVLVMASWAWSCLTFKRGARLIIGKVGPIAANHGLRHRSPATDSAYLIA